MFPKDLSTFTVSGITELRAAAKSALDAKRAAVEDPENAPAETLAELKDLKDYVVMCDAEIKARQERAAEFAATEVTDPEPVVTETETTEPVVTETETVTASTEVTPAVQTGREGATVRSVQVADVAQVPTTEPIPVTSDEHFAIKAAADVPGFITGQELDWDGIGKAFEARARAYSPTGARASRGPRLQHGFALIERQMPEHQQILDNETDFSLHEKLTRVQTEALEKSKENNSLVAAAGWCAPSETIYSTVNPVTTDGLLDLPEVVARRGGIRHNQGINWASFFGNGTTFPALDVNVPGMTLLTEAQVIADTAKTCLEIDCPPFIDERLNVAALCLTGSLLQNRGYPEYVAEFTRGALAAFAHLVNREVIDIIEDGSTASLLTTTDPWQVEGTVVSSLMSAIEMAVMDMRYRLRLARTTPIEFIFPEWIKAQLRADYVRRNAAASDDLADAEIAAMFARRGANVRYVYDWQDAFTGTTNGPGTLTAGGIVQLPNQVRFIAYPAGTWILARQDVIRLDTVYDSVNLQLNQVTQLFMEDGYLPMRMGPLSRVYTLPIAPSGITGAQRAAGTGGAGGAALVYADVVV